MTPDQFMQAYGRGTNVLKRVDDSWRVIHEHLSIRPV